MDSIWGFIGLMVLVCGIYAVYSYVKMNKKGVISASLLLGKEAEYKKCKDKEAYIKKAGPALLLFGFASVIYGAIDVIHCYAYEMKTVDTVGMVIWFVILVWFAVYTTKLKKQYF